MFRQMWLSCGSFVLEPPGTFVPPTSVGAPPTPPAPRLLHAGRARIEKLEILFSVKIGADSPSITPPAPRPAHNFIGPIANESFVDLLFFSTAHSPSIKDSIPTLKADNALLTTLRLPVSLAFLRVKREFKPSMSRWSPPTMGPRNPRGVTSALLAFCGEIEILKALILNSRGPHLWRYHSSESRNSKLNTTYRRDSPKALNETLNSANSDVDANFPLGLNFSSAFCSATAHTTHRDSCPLPSQFLLASSGRGAISGARRNVVDAAAGRLHSEALINLIVNYVCCRLSVDSMSRVRLEYRFTCRSPVAE
ncbi:hypothetical protein EVAR_67139_1 [Eumeta japonica]|uniref:Uncharacterized protein n=1 Tax=Eumeta variegata TaxID=151549 RepID=A0A4C1ZVQ4_EUMVA|nr:hypothetical protein EVAR_67139_1 [Eumeta japonica]